MKKNVKDLHDKKTLEELLAIFESQAKCLSKVNNVTTGDLKFDLGRNLIYTIVSKCRAIHILTAASSDHEVQIIARSLLENIIDYYYIQSSEESEFKNYIDYGVQKSYRVKAGRKITVGEHTFEIKNQTLEGIDDNDWLKLALEKFTSKKSGKPITRWTNQTLVKKLEKIHENNIIDIRRLMLAVLSIHEDASETVHNTFYGNLHLYGIFDGVHPGDYLQQEKYYRKILNTNLYLINSLLCSLGCYVGKVVSSDDALIKSRENDEANSQIVDDLFNSIQ
ncbi:DUF5677 domain-containing protein [Kangiella sp. M94]